MKQGQTYDSPMVGIVDSYAAIYFELLLKYVPDVTYQITTTELGRKVMDSDYYKINGYEYFIHNDGLSYRIRDPVWREKYPKSAVFYDSLDQAFKHVKSIEPSPTRSGTTIKIYKIQ
jgi:hypothetical protein